ncbi:MAG TPA: S1 RNA-binding domain-containing protein [Thermodesulfovibrionales bacterium]|nr:S1 RNA-binding domain-containing protein [Thermodesulfovibrionales bacterium]
MNDDNMERNSPDTGGVNVAEQEDFASMFEKSSMGERLYPGQKIRARVVNVSGDRVYIDIGGKSEGAVDLAEFVDKEGVVNIREGDEIAAYFVTVQDGLMRLTTLVGGYSAATLDSIRDAHEAGVPVNGEVKAGIKGGFDVSVGGVRCFCPFSQIDLKAVREAGAYLGQTFPFKVLEYGEEGRNIVLSRKALLEEEKKAKIEELKKSLAVGMEIVAEVKSVQKFGAFVDLGGVDALIPASEISWDKSVNPGDALSIGQSVTVKIISLEWDKGRLTVSMKATQPDPWVMAAEKYQVGSKVGGTIVRLSAFGAFVRLEPGIDGLVHISNLGAGRRINHPREVVDSGQWVEVYVLSVDPEGRKIALSMQPKVEPVKVVLPAVGEILDGIVEKVMPYGIFLKVNDGLTGLIPNLEMGTPSGSDHKRMFPPGAELQAAVIDVDAVNNKVRLSRKAVIDKAAQDEFNEYKESLKPAAASSGKFGSLGDILKAKMEEKKNSFPGQ